MSAQSDRIAHLSAEVDTLKTTLGGGQTDSARVETEKDKRIRLLEKELEGLKSS